MNYPRFPFNPITHINILESMLTLNRVKMLEYKMEINYLSSSLPSSAISIFIKHLLKHSIITLFLLLTMIFYFLKELIMTWKYDHFQVNLKYAVRMNLYSKLETTNVVNMEFYSTTLIFKTHCLYGHLFIKMH